MAALTQGVVLSAFICTVYSIAIPPQTTMGMPPTPPQGCPHGGKMYQFGETFGSICSPCRCDSSGRASCLVIDCFFGMCEDAVHDPTKCCPTCPNGANCRHQDGTIIKEGSTYRPDNYTSCTCPPVGFGNRIPICSQIVMQQSVKINTRF